MKGSGTDRKGTTAVTPREGTGLASGVVLRERFELQRVLGEGGMGKVFLAVDREVDGPNPYVAIKVLGEQLQQHPDALTALRREATNARQLHHPNIVGVYHFDRDGPHVFIVMEYMRGQSLDAFIREHPTGVPSEQAWSIIRDCAAALAYMHEHHIVHSDFKPGNVFLTSGNEARVLDLGIARTVDQTMLAPGRTRFDTGMIALTPQYASCEMFAGMAPDQRDDLYALGCVAYELLTGRHPFDGATAVEARSRALVPEQPEGLSGREWRAIKGLLALDRAARTPTAEAFLAELSPAQPRQRMAPWALAAASLAVFVAGAALYATRDSPDERFIEQLVIEHRDARDPTVGPAQVARWLEQADVNMALARQAFAAGDYERGRFFLADGASSARWVLTLVLRTAPDAADKRRAAEGLLTVSKLYEMPASALFDEEAFEDGLSYTCEGLRVNGFEPSLNRLFERYRARVREVRAIEACVGLAAARY